MAKRVPSASAHLLLTVYVSALTSLAVVGFFLYAVPYMRPEALSLMGIYGSTRATATMQVPPSLQPLATTSADLIVEVVKRSQPAVVAVSVSATVSPVLMRKMLSVNWMDPTDVKQGDERIDMGGGSGFFVSSDGIVVTNRHVVDNQFVHEAKDASYSVTAHDGRVHVATLLASDPVLDLAFLKVAGVQNVPYLTFGDSDALQPGQSVIAIGNALDEFRNSITSGIVSGLDRRIIAGDDGLDEEIIEEAIQTDAAINVGNSGGPLLDLRGQVIGVNTAVSDSGQSLGFSLPSNSVKRSLASVERYGRVLHPYLGVRYVLIDEQVAELNKLSVGHGALVAAGPTSTDTAVAPGSPAEKAGIRQGDVIMAIGGREVIGEQSLITYIGRYAPGDTVRMRLNRNGRSIDISVVLGEAP